MNENTMRGRSRAQLVLVLVIGLGSLGGAWLLFYLTAEGELWGTTNNGTFVEPPRTAAELGLRTASGARFETGGKWWLWVVAHGPCADACRHAVHQQRQLHVLLNRDAARVRRALLTSAPADPALLERYPRLEVLSGNLAELRRGVYVVDPLGNLVLYYPLQDAGEPVLDDLERLLKVSQIG